MYRILQIAATLLVSISMLVSSGIAEPEQLQKITINYPARTGTAWPLYIAKDGVYYEKMRKFDFRTVLDNSIVDPLVKEGFFEKLFGPGIKAEQDRKAKVAFR